MAERIVAPKWFDLFTFDDPTEILCPDCEVLSPSIENVFAAVEWVFEHEKECPGYDLSDA